MNKHFMSFLYYEMAQQLKSFLMEAKEPFLYVVDIMADYNMATQGTIRESTARATSG